MVENGWTELVEKYERTKKRLALFEATRVEDALARLREPDIDNNGGPGNIAEAVECLLHNNKQFGYDLVELVEKYEKTKKALEECCELLELLAPQVGGYGPDGALAHGREALREDK